MATGLAGSALYASAQEPESAILYLKDPAHPADVASFYRMIAESSMATLRKAHEGSVSVKDPEMVRLFYYGVPWGTLREHIEYVR